MVIKSRAPRWYQWKDGQITPMYELAKKSGNGNKPYSLREARELKLLPSVTSVLSVIDKPELDNWRVSQAIHSALTLPIIDGEPPDKFAVRVLADAEAQANNAAEFGTRIHDAIAAHLTSFEKEPDPDLVPFLMPFADWAMENIQEVHAVEKCVGHPSIGVAGRMDLDCTLKGVGRCVVDFKTSAIKNGKPAFWDSFPLQLSAYRSCIYADPESIDMKMVSIIIPSSEPGPLHVKVWDESEKYYLGVFLNALEIWIYKNNYDPRQP